MNKPSVKMNHLNDQLLGGLWGAIVGDALGVPVDPEHSFESHNEGYGTNRVGILHLLNLLSYIGLDRHILAGWPDRPDPPDRYVRRDYCRSQ